MLQYIQKIATGEVDLHRFLHEGARWSDLVKKDRRYNIDASVVNAYRASMTQRVVSAASL